MTSSLVGSEMCIRDSTHSASTYPYYYSQLTLLTHPLGETDAIALLDNGRRRRRWRWRCTAHQP
eukprot:11730785-Prorocentrum_lima.AAC.1